MQRKCLRQYRDCHHGTDYAIGREFHRMLILISSTRGRTDDSGVRDPNAPNSDHSERKLAKPYRRILESRPSLCRVLRLIHSQPIRARFGLKENSATEPGALK